MLLDTDAAPFGGHGRLVADQVHHSLSDPAIDSSVQMLRLYLPTRTAIVLEPER